FEDIRKLLGVLGRLVDNGNTVVVIEHNLDVIKTADWLIDMGPEGGSRGGTVIDEGTPEKIAANPRSYTGEFLRPILEGREVPVGEAQPSLLDAGPGRPVTKAAAKRAAAEARQAASAAKKAAATAKKSAATAKKSAATAKTVARTPVTKAVAKKAVAKKPPVKTTGTKRAPVKKSATRAANGGTSRPSARLAG
ncbi:MAG TPA: excinuclease ABC subunit A, partial [Microlunatus sp.]|nr:excinuclease ABC subunit A [Microlunatus sp.]